MNLNKLFWNIIFMGWISFMLAYLFYFTSVRTKIKHNGLDIRGIFRHQTSTIDRFLKIVKGFQPLPISQNAQNYLNSWESFFSSVHLQRLRLGLGFQVWSHAHLFLASDAFSTSFNLVFSSGHKLTMYEWNDDKMYPRMMAMKKQNPNLKVLLAVGGWNHENGNDQGL